MANKEDILEQVVEDYFLFKGYFTRHNDRFKPHDQHPEYVKQSDAVNSDIDVIAINPNLSGPEAVCVVTCKSWQGGFRPERWIDAIEKDGTISGRKAWKAFRELTSTKWAESFCHKVHCLTGSQKFTYITAVTKLNGDPSVWENYTPHLQNLGGNPIKVLTFSDMIDEIYPNLNTTLAATQVGRLLKLFKAARMELK